jgi:hypothetical protein
MDRRIGFTLIGREIGLSRRLGRGLGRSWAVSESGSGVSKNQPDNIDLMKLQKAAWRSLGYEP